jgi:hypothetical protein
LKASILYTIRLALYIDKYIQDESEKSLE